MAQSSKIFLQNRAIGYVSNHVPLIVRYIASRKQNLVVTCIGKSFHTYSCNELRLIGVSKPSPEDISCMAGDSFHTFTASENVIQAWKRGTVLKFTYIGHTSPVHILLAFGNHLVSVDKESNLKIWEIKAEEVYMELTFDNSTFEITTVLHPSTYQNKLLLGSTQGVMQLWNVLTSTLVYTFKSLGAPITVLEQAPALDVVAIGLADGKIILHNLKYDKTVMEFVQDWGMVTSLSFRTDGIPMLCSGTPCGHIVFWDLEERVVASQLLAAHDGAVTGMQCLPNEPLLITSSIDNSLRIWIFDMADGGARQLTHREGHSAPPTCLRFYDDFGFTILSAGSDSALRMFSTRNETLNRSLGKASYNRTVSRRLKKNDEDPFRMPPILRFSAETTREKEWDNIAAMHSGIPMVTTWSSERVTMGKHLILPERFAAEKRALINFENVDTRRKAKMSKDFKSVDKKEKKFEKQIFHAHASSLCLTHCGNFVVIGYSSGHVDRFNVQSGLHRATYGVNTAHSGPVRGVTTDGLNKLTITGGKDAVVKFWRFTSSGPEPLVVLDVDEPVSFFCTHRESSIVAIALEDFSVTVIDIDSRQIIRKFVGHSSQLTDATFSPDSRWLITASMDCTIRTWDVPSGQLVDCFRVDVACTSLTFSLTGDMLATAHVNYLGIALWSNRTLFSFFSLHPISETDEHPLVSMPGTMVDERLGSSVEVEDLEDFADLTFKSPEQINIDLVTLSSVANSRWQNLLNIDIIKKRNRPKSGLKVPIAVPFFLPTIPALEFTFDLSAADQAKEVPQDLTLQFKTLTAFGKTLFLAQEPNQLTAAFEKLKSFGPSAIDHEIHSLSVETGGTEDLLIKFMKMIELTLNSNKDFELAQAYLGLFLKKHAETITASIPLLDYLGVIEKCQVSSWAKLQDNMLFNLCVIDSLKNG